jgi:hypothetical protein
MEMSLGKKTVALRIEVPVSWWFPRLGSRERALSSKVLLI